METRKERTSPEAVDQDEESADNNENKFLTFKIGDEQYGIGIDNVIEIIEVIKITPIPEMENFLKGIINLRGKVIPVMDVRLRFGLDEREHDSKTCIVVVKIDSVEIGLIVDTVNEVIDIDKSQIDPPPQMHNRSVRNYVMGIGKTDKGVVILLNLSNMVFGETLEMLKAAAA